MDFKDLVKARFSLRKFDTKLPDRESINACLEAARLAPSSCNSQPWQFIVVDNPQIKEKIINAMFSKIHGFNAFVNNAPVLVIVVTDTQNWLLKVCNILRDTKMYLIDIGITCEHFCLQAAELGIGTCILGWFNEKPLKKLLKLGRDKRIDVVIAVGFASNEVNVQEKIRKPLSEIYRYLDDLKD